MVRVAASVSRASALFGTRPAAGCRRALIFLMLERPLGAAYEARAVRGSLALQWAVGNRIGSSVFAGQQDDVVAAVEGDLVEREIRPSVRLAQQDVPIAIAGDKACRTVSGNSQPPGLEAFNCDIWQGLSQRDFIE